MGEIMNLTRATFAALACCALAGPLSAQSSSGRPRARTAMLAALHLTETQKTQVKAIHKKYSPTMKAAQQQTSDSASRIYDREMAEVRTILTSSQQDTFDSYMSGKSGPDRGRVAKVLPAKIAVPR
jgi:Spy/CpxP family protein refolding chaperone